MPTHHPHAPIFPPKKAHLITPITSVNNYWAEIICALAKRMFFMFLCKFPQY